MLTYKIVLSEFGLNALEIGFTGLETMEFEVIDFYKDSTFINTLYAQISEYVATLPIESQRGIYDTFSAAFNDERRNSYGDVAATLKLERSIDYVSRLLNYENFKNWIRLKECEMIIPETIQDSFTHDPDMNTTIEKTYVRHEYVDLIALIIFIRAISPLYLDFYNYIKVVTSHYYYKIFMLFIQSDIYISPEIEKLKRYIEVNQQTLIGTSKNEQLIINAGLSDDDILDSLVSEIIFNKLLTIDFFNKKCNIISFIFQTIKYKGNFVSPDSVAIRGKTPVNGNTKEDTSYFEDYRKTSDVPIGTIAEIQHSLSDVGALVNILGYSNFDFDRYYRELRNVPRIIEMGIDKTQINLLGWFLDKIVNPRALYHIELHKVVELMMFAKVVLLQNNQRFIATVLSSYKTKESNFINVTIKGTLNVALVKKLRSYYNFAMEESKLSIIEQTVMDASNEIRDNLWLTVGENPESKEYITKEGYINIPNNINDLIYSYIAFVNSGMPE